MVVANSWYFSAGDIFRQAAVCIGDGRSMGVKLKLGKWKAEMKRRISEAGRQIFGFSGLRIFGGLEDDAKCGGGELAGGTEIGGNEFF